MKISSKILSLFLFILFICLSLLTGNVFADTATTTISATGSGTEQYSITIPSILNVGTTGTISVNGTWPSYRTLTVKAPSNVTLSNGRISLTGSVACNGFSLVGNDAGSSIMSSTSILVSCPELASAFGTFTGTINYNVSLIGEPILQSISLSSTSLSMNTGDTQTLTVNYNPSNTTSDKTVTWSSSNTSVATVSNGVITAKGRGTATITAKVGDCTATCSVTVKGKTITFQTRYLVYKNNRYVPETTTYTAEEGMTWGEYIEIYSGFASWYGLVGYVANNSGGYLYYAVYSPSGDLVIGYYSTDEVIINGFTYEVDTLGQYDDYYN